MLGVFPSGHDKRRDVQMRKLLTVVLASHHPFQRLNPGGNMGFGPPTPPELTQGLGGFSLQKRPSIERPLNALYRGKPAGSEQNCRHGKAQMLGILQLRMAGCSGVDERL